MCVITSRARGRIEKSVCAVRMRFGAKFVTVRNLPLRPALTTVARLSAQRTIAAARGTLIEPRQLPPKRSFGFSLPRLSSDLFERFVVTEAAAHQVDQVHNCGFFLVRRDSRHGDDVFLTAKSDLVEASGVGVLAI
jgi:hypothetical protein